ncbi:hypothetical protein AB0M28_20235 [Streptomyces sp. NPDC051940]|uniref:hypothetical protein n=1 Tax=Streptomyces sp. NPDC051940 TaxID=3155675 RepID=UPI00343F3B10
MYLALLELKAARGRFLLMGSVVVLVAALVGIVSGFTTGLGDDTVSALRRLTATHIAFTTGSDSDQFARSLIDEPTADGWRREQGVQATPLGIAITAASRPTSPPSAWGPAPSPTPEPTPAGRWTPPSRSASWSRASSSTKGSASATPSPWTGSASA